MQQISRYHRHSTIKLQVSHPLHSQNVTATAQLNMRIIIYATICEEITYCLLHQSMHISILVAQINKTAHSFSLTVLLQNSHEASNLF